VSGFSSSFAASVAWGLIPVGAGAAVLTAIAGVVQGVRGIPLDWWALGSLFVSSLFVMAWITWVIQKREKQGVLEPPVYIKTEPKVPSLFGRGDISSIVLIVESSINEQETNYPLKLWIMWINAGVDVHLGKPQ
jgi:hypothetical protein